MKNAFRHHIRLKVQSLDSNRRFAASKQISTISLPPGLILSFASMKDEIDLTQLNQKLASEHRLVLPRVDRDRLSLFKVDRLSQLSPGAFGILEPILELCALIHPHELSCALIPGLAFDPNNNRLGRGRGYYDKLLSTLPKQIPTIGLGFHEQLCDSLPIEQHDIALTSLALF
jgi:5-formyltetrahydrofolate cyclo-ligase